MHLRVGYTVDEFAMVPFTFNRDALLYLIGAASGAIASYLLVKKVNYEGKCCCSGWSESVRAIAMAAAATKESCPGMGNVNAGTSPGCAGCPNRQFCAEEAPLRTNDSTGSKSVPEGFLSSSSALSHDAEVAEKLNGVKNVIIILSGKGGVGKSTVTSQLGWALCSKGYRVGICDLDLCGPSIPLMVNKVGEDIYQSAEGWQPCFVRDNFCVMSIAYLLAEKDSAVIWRGPKKTTLIRSLLSNVCWGDLDILLVDTPPGTSDEHISIVSLIKATGALVITTPQEASLQDVRREINFCRKTQLTVLGVVENMASSMFSIEAGSVTKMCKDMGVPYIGSIPLDSVVLNACEGGFGVSEMAESTPAREAFLKLSQLVEDVCGMALEDKDT